jgi:phosphatidylserine decarboxylase|tara:strand:- start:2114 stop:2809 length:696 start_codon:yes stop_codon:yes gene_type:complete
METIFSVFVPIHKEGYKYIGIFAAVTLIFLWIGLDFLFTASLILTLWCAYFFRDPERVTPQKEGLIIAPADGVVQSVKLSLPPAELGMGEEECIRVSIFMNVFNVHVNRVPADGKILRQAYTRGKYLNASLEKACVDNERHAILMETTSGNNIAFVQIAGLVARRILCWVEDGNEMNAGERFGLIRFGSRVDLYLPKGINSLVSVGQSAIAGETVIASEKGREKQRNGEIR